MWYKIVEHKDGRYVDKDGKIYILVQCHRAMDPEGKKNAELGLTKFETLEDCLTVWELTKIEPKKEVRNGRQETEI